MLIWCPGVSEHLFRLLLLLRATADFSWTTVNDQIVNVFKIYYPLRIIIYISFVKIN